MSSNLESKASKSGKTTPLFWNRMLRFSIYLTVLGVGLGFILGKMVHSAINEAYATELAQPKVLVERVDADGNLLDNQNLTSSELLAMPNEYSEHADDVAALAHKAKTFNILVFVSPFLFLGIISILVCLLMRKRELSARAAS